MVDSDDSLPEHVILAIECLDRTCPNDLTYVVHAWATGQFSHTAQGARESLARPPRDFHCSHRSTLQSRCRQIDVRHCLKFRTERRAQGLNRFSQIYVEIHRFAPTAAAIHSNSVGQHRQMSSKIGQIGKTGAVIHVIKLEYRTEHINLSRAACATLPQNRSVFLCTHCGLWTQRQSSPHSPATQHSHHIKYNSLGHVSRTGRPRSSGGQEAGA